MSDSPKSFMDSELISAVVAMVPGTPIPGALAEALGLREGTSVPRPTADWAVGPRPGPLGGGVLPEADDDMPVLALLLASENDEVAAQARAVLSARADAGFLRAVRRSLLPPKARRHALVMLAEIGWSELDAADRELARRLIRIKLRRNEPLQPVTVNASWFALPTADTAEVVVAFGLCDPVAVPANTGFALFAAQRRAPRQVFVSPAVDGWTLVLSAKRTGDADWEDIGRSCAELSRRFGAARHYTMWDEGYSGWCVADRGRLLRYAYCSKSFPEGSPVDVATGRALFLLPTAFDARTRVEGTGVLAVPPALRDRRRGVLHLGRPGQ